ncbi:unnamed protein product, partial [Rotaria sp. Silwood1]
IIGKWEENVVCGDPIDGPRNNEASNGIYFTGTIVGTYRSGAVMDVRIEMMANHLGWFTFKICPVTDNAVEVTQECLDRYPLKIVKAPTTITNAYRWDIPGTGNVKKIIQKSQNNRF